VSKQKIALNKMTKKANVTNKRMQFEQNLYERPSNKKREDKADKSSLRTGYLLL
jgi:hypothetical protein